MQCPEPHASVTQKDPEVCAHPEPPENLAVKAAALTSRISVLRNRIDQLAKLNRDTVTASDHGALLKPTCEALAAAAADCLDLLERADLLPDEPYLGRLVEARKELADRCRVIHHRRSPGPALKTMRDMAHRLDTLGANLLLCIGEAPAPLLGYYVSRFRRDFDAPTRELRAVLGLRRYR